MRWHVIRVTRPCVAAGKRRAPGAVLAVDDVLAARGEPNCIGLYEAMHLVLVEGAAVRPEDEPSRPARYMTRIAHA